MEDGFEKVLVALGAMEAAKAEREKGTAKGGDFEAWSTRPLTRSPETLRTQLNTWVAINVLWVMLATF